MTTPPNTGKWAIRITALAAVAGVGLTAGVAIMQYKAAQPRIYVRATTDASAGTDASPLVARILVTVTNVGEQRVSLSPGLDVSGWTGTGGRGSSIPLMFRSSMAASEAVLAPAALKPGEEITAVSTDLGISDLPPLRDAMVVTFSLTNGNRYRATLSLADTSSLRTLIKGPRDMVLWGASALAVREK